MTELDQWSIEDLRALVATQASETLTLEFKASDALGKTDSKRREITKDVSAFANSAGGVIIYGLVEEPTAHVADHLDAGTNQHEIPPEWIDQVVNAGIHPRIDGLRVDTITIGDLVTGGTAYVVVVPESLTAHMAQDHRYYKRLGREVLMMEDYEVRDVMARASVPRLGLEIVSTPVQDLPHALDVELYLVNEAATPAEWCIAQLIVPSTLNLISDGGADASEQRSSEVGTPVTALRFQYGGINRIPIWQGLRVCVRPQGGLPVRIAASAAGVYSLGWRTTAPGMGWRNGQTTVIFT